MRVLRNALNVQGFMGWPLVQEGAFRYVEMG